MPDQSRRERTIVIVGGGIIGCSSAYFLTRHPSYDPEFHRILVIEASSIAAGASGKAGGLLAQWAYPKCIVPLSFKAHADLAKEHNGKDRWGYRVVKCGNIVAKGKPLVDVGQEDKSTNSFGIWGSKWTGGGRPPQRKGRAAIPEELNNWLEADALRFYDDMDEPGSTAQVHPFYFTNSMMELAEDRGAQRIMGKVINIRHTPKQGIQSITYTDNATGQSCTIPADDVVLSAGPWTREIYPEAPITAIRSHSIVIRPDRELSAQVLFTDISLPSKYDGKQTGNIRVYPEIYCRPDDTVYACGEGDNLPLPPTAAEVEVDDTSCKHIFDSISSISRALKNGQILKRQACYLPNVSSPRGGPLIGWSGIKGLFLATGHTCWGIQNGPGTGKLVSELVYEGEAKSANIESLNPKKFP